jgi:transcriptional regulator with XRE-family HTH domain
MPDEVHGCLRDLSTGALIKYYRTQVDVSPETLASFLRCSASTLRRIEQDQREPRLSELLGIAAFLQLDPLHLCSPAMLRAIAVRAEEERPLRLFGRSVSAYGSTRGGSA